MTTVSLKVVAVGGGQAWDKGLVNFLQEINLDTGGAISFGNATTNSILAPGYEDIADKVISKINTSNNTDP